MRSPRLALSLSAFSILALGCMCGGGDSLEEFLEDISVDLEAEVGEIQAVVSDTGSRKKPTEVAAEEVVVPPVLAANLSDACAPWHEATQSMGGLAALFQDAPLERAVRRMNLNAECELETYDGTPSMDCSFDNDDWSFVMEAYQFSDAEDAEWEADNLDGGEAFRREGLRTLNVSGENYRCARAVFERFFPAGARIRDLNEQAISAKASALGFKMPSTGCNLSRYSGEVSLECPMAIGPGLNAILYVSYPMRDAGGEEYRWSGGGSPTMSQGDASASISVTDKPSAEALLRALAG